MNTRAEVRQGRIRPKGNLNLGCTNIGKGYELLRIPALPSAQGAALNRPLADRDLAVAVVEIDIEATLIAGEDRWIRLCILRKQPACRRGNLADLGSLAADNLCRSKSENRIFEDITKIP